MGQHIACSSFCSRQDPSDPILLSTSTCSVSDDFRRQGQEVLTLHAIQVSVKRFLRSIAESIGTGNEHNFLRTRLVSNRTSFSLGVWYRVVLGDQTDTVQACGYCLWPVSNSWHWRPAGLKAAFRKHVEAMRVTITRRVSAFAQDLRTGSWKCPNPLRARPELPLLTTGRVCHVAKCLSVMMRDV